jgi:glycine/D-amino acid oxidase-like deaminating enzyme
VVGAGITGLITTVLLARAGKSVIVLEELSAGAGATGNTTAKISLLQGTKLSKMIDKHGPNWRRASPRGCPPSGPTMSSCSKVLRQGSDRCSVVSRHG